MIRRLAVALGLAVALSPGPPLPAQGRYDTYAALYGEPVEVELTDLAHGDLYQKKAVITRGSLDMLDLAGHYFRLRDEGAEVAIIPTRDVYDEMRRLMGKEVEVVGLARELPLHQSVTGCGPQSRCEDPELPPLPNHQPAWPRFSVTIWGITDLTSSGPRRKIEYKAASLEALVTRPGRRDGQPLRVVGKFRGRNLYGDLPVKSQRSSSDWVIKDEAFAVWVVGKKPKGPGWQLDPGLKRDTGRWIEVVGRPETRNGITYLKAVEVSLSSPPAANAAVEAPPPPPERPKLPPVVVFALPLDGDREVAADSRFVVQFNKDMDEATFAGRVQLRYAGPPRPGDRPFDGIKLSYDGGRRALTVDPGDVLRPGRELELLLLPGIADVDGLALTSRPGKAVSAAEAVEVLRFQVQS